MRIRPARHDIPESSLRDVCFPRDVAGWDGLEHGKRENPESVTSRVGIFRNHLTEVVNKARLPIIQLVGLLPNVCNVRDNYGPTAEQSLRLSITRLAV